jgi:nucleoside phosphorylase
MHTSPEPDPPQTTVERVLVLFALLDEAMPLVERLRFPEVPSPEHRLPQRHWAGRIGTAEFTVVVNGRDPRCGSDRVGTDAATLAAWTSIRSFAPDLVLNAGTCGGFEARGGSVGALYCSSGNLLFHDRRIPLDRFALQAAGRWPSADAPNLAKAIGARPGVVSTGNSLDVLPGELEFFAREGVVAKDMEACSIAQVCALAGVPFVAVKAVTDLVDHPEPVQEAFLRNLRMASTLLGERMEAGLRWLGAHPRRMSEL